jgi:hypothetical protein
MNEETATIGTESQPVELMQPETMTDGPERNHWLRTGELPEIKPKKAEPAPAKAVEQPAKSDQKAESESATQKQPKKADASDRKQELSAEIKQLLEKRAVLREDALWQEFEDFQKSKATKAATPPAAETKPQGQPEAPEKPKRPEMTEFQTVEHYKVAMDKYDAAMAEYYPKKQAFDDFTAKQAKAQAETKERIEKTLTDWKNQAETYEKDHPGFLKKLEAINSQIQEGSPLDIWVVNSDKKMGAQILDFLSDNPKELERINSLSWTAAQRELAALEDKLETPAKPKEEKSAATEEVPQPKAKKVTEAPPPPVEVGGKGTTAGDPMVSALAEAKRGNTAPYMRLMNERDIERRKRGR